MAADQDFLAELLSQLAPLGGDKFQTHIWRRGYFCRRKMFAKISPSNIIAFKAGEQCKASFLELGMRKSRKMPYYEATADQLEYPEALLAVARRARKAALR